MKRFLVLIGAVLIAVGCSDDPKKGGPEDCPTGQSFNPISGRCEPRGVDNNDTDAGDIDLADNNATDAGNNHQTNNTTTPVDMGGDIGDLRCAPGRDDDGDGLENDCECVLGTDSTQADTDGDGLNDGDEDANGNCELDPGQETDARNRDTDADGASDGDELAEGTDPLLQDSDEDGIFDGVELGSCTSALDADTDGDGLPDGVEDANADGELGTCPNRMYDPACAQGESNPCAADTDGDGSPDSDEAQYRDCRPEDLNGLTDPQLLTNMAADYQLALEQGVATDAVTFASGSAEAHVFEDAANGYTGFVASLDPGGQTNPSLLADDVVGRIQGVYPSAARRVSGRRITTHDNFNAAVGGIIDLPAGTALDGARDDILATLATLTAADVSHGLNNGLPGDTSQTLFVFEVVSRSASQYVIAGALVTLDDYQDDTGRSGIRVDDITGGTAIALADESLVDECVAYRVTTVPQVDIIISLDASGSMGDEQAALSNFANEFTTLLNGANVDWRVGVTSVNCSGAGADTNLSMDFRALFPSGGGFPPMGPCPSIFGMGGGNGALVGGDFTTDPAAIAARLNAVDGTNSEYTATMGLAAVDRALPREDGQPAKIRSEAAVVVIAITDEEDDFFEESLSFLSTTSLTLTQSQRTELEMAAQGFVDYALSPDVGATVFGLYWPPGEQCGTAQEVAHSVAHIVNETGGGGGSICQVDITNTLAQIADASAGIASGLRLRGVPVAPTLQVVHGDTSTGMIVDMPRSRSDGFDYDPIVNRVSFKGPNPPETNDRVVIPYRRWENSIFTCVTTDDCPAAQKLKCVDGECR